VEAQACTEADRIGTQFATELGLQLVYRGRSSLAQPDYTAECLAARNAGVQVWQIGLDPPSISRVAAACARQGYRPIFATHAGLILDRQGKNPNLGGMIGHTNVFPYFQRNTPATAEFQAAVKRFAPNADLGVGMATGWTSGKLFERAAMGLPERPSS